MKNYFLLSVIVCLAACTDADIASVSALGNESEIKCYSGGQVIFDDTSTGKISQGDHGGLYFQSKATGKFVRAYADCIIHSK